MISRVSEISKLRIATTLGSSLMMMLFLLPSSSHAGVVFTNMGSPAKWGQGAQYNVGPYYRGQIYLGDTEDAIKFTVGGTSDVQLDSVITPLKASVHIDFHVNLYSDSANLPGSLLESISMTNVDTNPGASYLYPTATLITANSTKHTILHAGQSYWMALDTHGEAFNWFFGALNYGTVLGAPTAGRFSKIGLEYVIFQGFLPVHYGQVGDWSLSAPSWFAPAITINGTEVATVVPEPGISVLMGSSLPLVLLVLRRKLRRRGAGA